MENLTDGEKKKLFGIVKLGFLSFIALIILFLAVETVEAGTVKVVTRWGRVTGRVLEPGVHFLWPFAERSLEYDTKKVIYETTTEVKQEGSDADYKDFPVDTNTEDGQQVDIFYTVRFSTDPTKAGWIAQNIGSQGAVVEKIVKTESRIWARNIPRRFDAEDLYSGNGSQEVQDQIFTSLSTTFSENGLILDSVGIREIKFTNEYVAAIEAKQLEAVKVKTAENIAERAVFEKEARITQAEGQAREQELQKTSISSELLEKMWIEKWNGNLPNYMMGDSQALIQLPQQ